MVSPHKATKNESIARFGYSTLFIAVLYFSALPKYMQAEDFFLDQRTASVSSRSKDSRLKKAKPNIVLINLDDADRDMFQPVVLKSRFPAIHEIAKRGISFTNFHVTSPLCGPSRACLLRGQYAHTIGYRSNNPNASKSRGFGKMLSDYFEEGGHYDNDLGLWMKNAGYHTALVGKHINNKSIPDRVPAGWDDYYRSNGAQYYKTVRFTNRHKRAGERSRIPDGEYRTNVEADDVVRIIGENGSSGKPLFLYFAPFGPHKEGGPDGMIDIKDKDLWRDISFATSEDFDEEDNADKPPEIKKLPRLTPEMKQTIQEIYRMRMISTKAVDRAVERIVRAFEQLGQLENTYIFVTSDNGHSLGNHRVIGKGTPLTRSAHVPLLVCGPGILPKDDVKHLLGHIDLAPTVMEIAGGSPLEFFDGKSFLPLLKDPENHGERKWRQGLLIENWDVVKSYGQSYKATFCQLRMFDETYTEWADGSREYYNLAKDPCELENTYSMLSKAQQTNLAKRLRASRRPLSEPLVTIENPLHNGSSFSEASLSIHGIAEDSNGIDRVDLLIRKRSTGEFWNGNNWQTERFALPTELKNINGVQTEWSFLFQPPEIVDEPESYSLIARAHSVDHRITKDVMKRHVKQVSELPVVEDVEDEESSQFSMAAIIKVLIALVFRNRFYRVVFETIAVTQLHRSIHLTWW